MHNIHPHWQEEDDAPVEVHVKPTTKTQAISRRPAALFGMVVVIGLGFVFFRGVDALRGQVGSGPTVLITENGIIPERIEVEHGQTIMFINDKQDPQSIVSQTLCSNTGFCLQTESINNGEAATFSIMPDMQSGEYAYTVNGTNDLAGTIAIVTDTAEDFVDFASVFDDPSPPPMQEQPDPSPQPTSFFDDPVPATTEATTQSAIPTNPYTIGSQYNQEPAQVAFTQTGGPIQQPETGAGTTIIFALSILALLWCTRDAFAKVQLH